MNHKSLGLMNRVSCVAMVLLNFQNTFVFKSFCNPRKVSKGYNRLIVEARKKENCSQMEQRVWAEWRLENIRQQVGLFSLALIYSLWLLFWETRCWEGKNWTYWPSFRICDYFWLFDSERKESDVSGKQQPSKMRENNKMHPVRDLTSVFFTLQKGAV